MTADFNGDGVLDLAHSDETSTTVGVNLATTVDGVAPIVSFSLGTLADARQALPIFQRKREQLAEQRGQIGAYQTRAEVASNVLRQSSENYQSAASTILDADLGEESSKLIRLQLLQQANAAILAQANQQPALALSLLS